MLVFLGFGCGFGRCLVGILCADFCSVEGSVVFLVINSSPLFVHDGRVLFDVEEVAFLVVSPAFAGVGVVCVDVFCLWCHDAVASCVVGFFDVGDCGFSVGSGAGYVVCYCAIRVFCFGGVFNRLSTFCL